jgi:site-specific DNA recombinase
LDKSLRYIVFVHLSAERFYGIAEEKANALLSSTKKELKQIEKQLNELDKLFNKLLNLHIDGTITTEQFRQQNERIIQQQQELVTKKAKLQSALEQREDFNVKIQYFRKEVERFFNIDIDDPQVLKQIIQKLIEKIEVFEGGKIKIYYNLSLPHSA